MTSRTASHALSLALTGALFACHVRGGDLYAEHMRRGKALFEEHSYARARIAYQRALALKPQSDEASLAVDLSAVAVAAQSPELITDSNINELDYAVDILGPRFPQYAFFILTTKGNLLARAGHTDDAVASYRKAIDAKRDYLPAYLFEATVLTQTGKATEGEAVLRAAVKLDPKDPGTHEALARVLAGKQAFDEAATVVREALVAGGTPRLNFLLGQIAGASGKLRDAEEAYAAGLKLAPSDAPTLFAMGQLLFQQNRGGDAKPYLARYLDVASAQGESSTRIGEVKAALGRLEAAANAPPPGAPPSAVADK